MNAEIARQVARNPAPHSRAVLALALDLLLREVEAGEARLDEAERLRTLGGRPPAYTEQWKPGTLPGGADPEYRGLGDVS